MSSVASNPEFLREGAAIRDFKHPDRIVVGTDDERARKVLAEIYRPLYLNQAPIMFTGRRTAELIKYAANAFLATKITFINEIADLAERSRRRRAGGRARHRARQPHRLEIPARRPRLRRLVLSEGHARAGEDRAGSRRPLRIVEAVLAVNETRKRAMARKVVDRARRQPARQDHRRARPHLQAEHRRHARGAVDPADHRADRSGREGARLRSGQHGAGTLANCRISTIATTPMPARRAPMRWSSSPSGSSSARSISSG